MMEYTLEVFAEDILIFYSYRNWLYPLFELEHFLAKSNYNPNDLVVKDKIVGRAAALLLAHFGIGHVIAKIMSKSGKEVLDKFGITNEHSHLVDQITCKTEKTLIHEFNTQIAYKIIKRKAGF